MRAAAIGNQVECSSCSASVDITETLRFFAESPLSQFDVVGAQRVCVEIELVAGEIFTLDVEAMTEPGARVLSVNYTPIGKGPPHIFPLELHSNTPHRRLGSRVLLYPRAIGEVPEGFRQRVGVFFYWLPQEIDDSLESLVDAFEAFSGGRHRPAVVPANAAIESHVARFFSQLIRQELKLKPEGFLQHGATYGHQLKVLLPLVAALTGSPQLDRGVHDALKRLLRLRNEIGHNKPLTVELGREDLAEMLTAAVLGFVYIDLLGESLLEREPPPARSQ
jgi:hypothetical protein